MGNVDRFDQHLLAALEGAGIIDQQIGQFLFAGVGHGISYLVWSILELPIAARYSLMCFFTSARLSGSGLSLGSCKRAASIGGPPASDSFKAPMACSSLSILVFASAIA